MATVNVSSFAELKTAVEDTTTTEISVLSDITYSGGIKVNLTKSNLIINFNNHKVIDNNTSTFTDTLYVASTSNTISVTVKNAEWSGRNYYGVIGVYNGDTNVTINLENITYIGPQFVYNKNGTTNITNCKITLNKNESSTNPQEFCEANRVNIAGNVNVISSTTSEAVIWFTGTNASLTVEENANFEVVASSTYFLYTDVSPILLFKKNSTTTIRTLSGLFYASGSSTHIAKSFTLEENASFTGYKQTSNSIPMFKCLSEFTLQPNSTFMLYSEVIGSAVLMYFGQTANLNFNSPKRVVLYNRGSNIFNFQTGSASTPNSINITTQMLRLWNYATSPLSSAGGLTDTPTSEYYKSNYSENLTAQIKSSSSALTTVDNNLIEGDTGYPMTTSLKLINSNVLSMGQLTLDIDEINDKSLSITGTTNTNANLQLEYDSISKTSTATDSGSFDFSLDSTISAGTGVKLSTNKQFLTKTLNKIVDGTLSIINVPALKFKTFLTPTSATLISRKVTDWGIEITDTRLSGDKWYLYAHISNPLSFDNKTLDNALIFKETDNYNSLSSTPMLIYTGEWNETNKTTNISWSELEGLLLNVNPNETYSSGIYKTDIFWQVTTSPLD